MAVNQTSWKSMPLAPRETTFSADDAIGRILQWSGGSASKFNSAFLWRDSQGEVGNRNSYRLPIADIVNGKLTMIPRAVFSAAVILSGGHGGLEGVVSDEDRDELRKVVTQIYEMLQEEYQDPRTVPPWLLGKTREEREEAREELGASLKGDDMGRMVWDVDGLVASVNTSWDLSVTDVDRAWDGDAARRRVWDWSGGDFRRYRRAFLWYDAARPEQKNSYKLPIADVIDGDLKIVPRGVNAVAAVLAGARGGVDIPDDDMASVERVVKRIQGRWQDSVEAGINKNYVQADMDEDAEHFDPDDGQPLESEEEEDEDSMTAAAAPVYPPSSAFEYDHGVTGPTPFTITADGRAFGHLWLWNRCHAGIADECVVAPRSATNYQYFHNGQVMTADGQLVRVGKITMGTGHAGPNMRWIPAADHYDNTGTVASIVRIHEDRFGGYAAGTVVSDLTDQQVQELRRSPISGDWRRINGNLELVAALAVNTPGFPIVASLNGEVQSMVAAGVLMPDGTVANEFLEASAAAEEDGMTDTERDLLKQVDDLDEKLTVLAERGRSRKWGRLMATLDERGK